MAMSKSCYNGCYNRRSCYNHGCCNQQSSGVSTGSLLAAGVAASLLVLALDCDDTTTTTTCVNPARLTLAIPFSYTLPGAASADKTLLRRTSARQPLGLLGYAGAGNSATAPTAGGTQTPNPSLGNADSSVTTYGYAEGAGATPSTVFSTTADTVGIANLPLITVPTATSLLQSYHVAIDLSPLFAIVTPFSATAVQNLFTTAGYGTGDKVARLAITISVTRFAGATASFPTAATAFPDLRATLLMNTAAAGNAAVITKSSGVLEYGYTNLYSTLAIDSAAAATVGKVQVFATASAFTTNLTTFAGITAPAANTSYLPVPIVTELGGGLSSFYEVSFTVADIVAAATASGATAKALKLLAFKSTYSPFSGSSTTNNVAGSSTTALTLYQNSTTPANGQTVPTNIAGLPVTTGNDVVTQYVQYRFEYLFDSKGKSFFVSTSNNDASLYSVGEVATRLSAEGALVPADAQTTLTSGTGMQGVALFFVGSSNVM